MKEIMLNSGIKIPMVGYGSYLSTDGRGKQVILDALDVGYRYIDTAYLYRNENEIGEAIAESGIARADLFICSKVWPTMLGTELTRASFEESCSALRTDYLDMYLIHWPKNTQKDDGWFDKVLEGWRVMEELYAEGRIKVIGVSNFLPHHLRPLLEQAKVKPAIDQLELHVGYMQEYTLSYLNEVGVMPQAWSPLGRARVLGDERVIRLAKKYGKSSAQVLLRYLIQRGIPVIPKASTKERMLENRDVFDFDLTADEISYLSCIPETGWSGEHPDLFED